MKCPQCERDVLTEGYFCRWCHAYLIGEKSRKKAGIFRRWFASFIDPAILLLLYLVFLLPSGGCGAVSESVGGAMFVICSLGYIVFFFWLLSKGLTPGKWILGEQVVNAGTGGNPGLWRMILRELIGKFVSGFVFGLGFIWAIFDRDNQAWHDKIAGTVVVIRS